MPEVISERIFILKENCKHCGGHGFYKSNVSRTFIKCRTCRGTGCDFSKKDNDSKRDAGE